MPVFFFESIDINSDSDINSDRVVLPGGYSHFSFSEAIKCGSTRGFQGGQVMVHHPDWARIPFCDGDACGRFFPSGCAMFDEARVLSDNLSLDGGGTRFEVYLTCI